jgi:hypothetical protein
VPISRRGLTAAGLAITAVGAVGVASTLNASAAQVAKPAPVVTSSSAVDDEPLPPPLFGGATQKAGGATQKAGRAAQKAGVAARSLSGFSVQSEGAAEEGSPQAPTPVYAPKGLPPLPGRAAAKPAKGATALRAQAEAATTSAATTSAAALAEAPSPSVNYFYSTSSQEAVTDGTTATMTIGKPSVHSRDSHSLAEIAVRSKDGQSAIEVGWTVSRHVNEQDKANLDEPHLFVYRWVNGKGACYNACDFLLHSTAAKAPGDLLTAGETKKFGIQHVGNSWWIWYDKGWIGRFPDSTWGGDFTKSDLVQWWGEVAAGSSVPCSEMGDGVPAGDPDAAEFQPITLINGPLVNIASGASAYYSIKPNRILNSTRYNGFRYGGNGGIDDPETAGFCS